MVFVEQLRRRHRVMPVRVFDRQLKPPSPRAPRLESDTSRNPWSQGSVRAANLRDEESA